jgi:hypothetical protein
MRRRKLLAGLGGLAGAGGIFGSAAFSRTAASRDLTVAVAEDDTALLRLEASGSPNGEFARQLDSGTLALDFTESDQGGQGVGTDSVYEFDDVFRVTNQGTQPVFVWGTFGGAAGDLTPDGSDTDVWLYPNDSRDTRLRDSDDAVIRLGAGETARIGVHVDTHEVTSDQDLTLTLNAGAEKPDGSSVTEPVRRTFTVGDGSDADYGGLQAAIDAASAGDRIEVTAGEYGPYEPPTSLKPASYDIADPSGLVIEGQGSAPGDVLINGSFAVTVSAASGNGLTIRNLSINSGGTNSNGITVTSDGGPTPGGIRFQNVRIEGHDFTELTFPDGVDGLTIENTKLAAAGLGTGGPDGLYVANTAKNVEIAQSVFQNNSDNGIELVGLDAASDVTITDSNFTYNGAYGIEAPDDVAVVEAVGCYYGGESDGPLDTDNRNGDGKFTGNVTNTNEADDSINAAGPS